MQPTRRMTDEQLRASLERRLRAGLVESATRSFDGTPCLEWTGAKGTRGYGHIYSGISGRAERTHRVAWEIERGEIPPGTELDHLCRNTGCASVLHIEPVPHVVNVHRGRGPAAINRLLTHCRKGHPFDIRNTRIEKGGARRCRACENAKKKAKKRARRLQARLDMEAA